MRIHRFKCRSAISKTDLLSQVDLPTKRWIFEFKCRSVITKTDLPFRNIKMYHFKHRSDSRSKFEKAFEIDDPSQE